ncbi:MAG: hypothetical protein JO247_06745 [Chloroflexi bacterium]|nr:hypothetical protein [Chloroflexota bacterium]
MGRGRARPAISLAFPRAAARRRRAQSFQLTAILSGVAGLLFALLFVTDQLGPEIRASIACTSRRRAAS